MLTDSLPVKINPRKFAEREVKLEGSMQLDILPNLCQSLIDNKGDVQVECMFSRDEQGIYIIKGCANGVFIMLCQRCLEAVEIRIATDFSLGIVSSESAAKQLPRYYDPLIVEGEDIELSVIIEQELILGLPFDAYHEDCVIKTSYGDNQSDIKHNQENPFSVLAQLKSRQ